MDNSEKEEALLTEEQVWDIIEYARAMTPYWGNAIMTPELINARMRDVNLNPMAASQELLDKAMVSPKEYEKDLQKFSQSFELSSMVYKRLISYLGNMLSFDVTYTSIDVKKPEEYKTPKYRKDVEIVEDILDRFEYKKEFRSVVREMLRNDAYFGCYRDDIGQKHILQELPPEYCKITGRWEGGFLFSFDMYWFLQPGVDVNGYPEFFKKKAKEIFTKRNANQTYNPFISPELRERSSWVYWVDVPPSVGVCFKLSPELATRLPYFTPLFNDLILQSTMRNLQKNINMAAANKIVMGQVPMLSKETKATVKDAIAITPEILGRFMALVKAAISDSVKIGALPLEDIRGIEFEGNDTLYDAWQKTALASSGVNSNLIFTSNIKPNAIETQLSLNADEQMMTALYEQFESFMDYVVNRKTKTYKFSIRFEGTDFFLNRQDRYDKAMALFDKGIIMPQKIAASIGMKPAEMRRHMEEASAFEFIKNLTPPAFEQQKEMQEITQKSSMEMQESAQKAAKENQTEAQKTQMEIAKTKTASPSGETSGEKGRPKKKLSELGEEGVQTRTEGTNIGRGGKVR